MKDIDRQIDKFIAKVRARLRELAIINRLLCFTSIGLGIALVFSIVSIFVPFYYAIWLATGAVLLALFIGIILGIKNTPSKVKSALLVDAKGHKEKVTTAYELKGRQDAFSLLQKRDAKKVIDNFAIRKEFPIKVKGKQAFLFVSLALLFTISSLIDTPARDQAAARHEVNKEVAEKIAKIEKVEKKIKDLSDVSEVEAKKIQEEIEETKKELKEAQTKADIKKAEERLTKKMEMASKQTENKTLSKTLNEEAKKTEEALSKEQQKLMEDALAAMEKAENGSKKDKKDAAKKLQDLARTLDDEELQKLADEYKDSNYSDADYAAAESALNATVSNMSKKNSDLASNNNNNQNNSQSNNSANAMQSENQNNSQSNSQSGNGNKSGNGDGNGTGNGSGSGSGKGNGSGSGSGSGTGTGWNKGSKDGNERTANTNENITVPDGETGNDDNLTGKANDNSSSTKQKSNQSKTWSGNKVSYGEVSGTYKDKAYKRINGSNYPSKLKDKIKNYFDDLN